jgi:VanZ family protein
MPPPAWLRAVCFAGFVAFLVQIFLLDQPPLLLKLGNVLWDKLLHCVSYAALAALLWVAAGFRAPFAAWIVVTAIGMLDEVHQIYIPTRTADALDVVADALGAALITGVLEWWRRTGTSGPDRWSLSAAGAKD